MIRWTLPILPMSSAWAHRIMTDRGSCADDRKVIKMDSGSNEKVAYMPSKLAVCCSASSYIEMHHAVGIRFIYWYSRRWRAWSLTVRWHGQPLLSKHCPKSMITFSFLSLDCARSSEPEGEGIPVHSGVGATPAGNMMNGWCLKLFWRPRKVSETKGRSFMPLNVMLELQLVPLSFLFPHSLLLDGSRLGNVTAEKSGRISSSGCSLQTLPPMPPLLLPEGPVATSSSGVLRSTVCHALAKDVDDLPLVSAADVSLHVVFPSSVSVACDARLEYECVGNRCCLCDFFFKDMILDMRERI